MDPTDHFRSHITKAYLEQLRNIAISAAGFSAGLLIFLAQTTGEAPYSQTALWAAIFALVTSLYGWQYVLPYIFYGEKTYEHFNVYVVALIQIVAVLAILVSVCAIVWQLSVYAGIALALLGLTLAILVLRHNFQVMRHSQASMPNKGFNRTPESSGPPKPGEPGGGAG